MDAKTRAEKIVRSWMGIDTPKENLEERAIADIAAQIEEAEREAFKEGRSTEDMRIDSIKKSHDICAHDAEEIKAKAYTEGFRAANEKANTEKGLEWAQGHQAGFREARDKAKGIAEEYMDEQRIGEAIAQRIGDLQP